MRANDAADPGTLVPGRRPALAGFVVVLGAGVIGLTTALALRARGVAVRLVAREVDDRTTSWVAGASWYPFMVSPPERAAAWADATRRWLTALAREHPASGVDVQRRHEVADSPDRPWWLAGSPEATLIRPDWAQGQHAWSFDAPRCDPPIFLPWLRERVGVPVLVAEVQHADALLDTRGPWPDRLGGVPDAVVNATGLGARTVARDHSVHGVIGQLVVAEHGSTDPALSLGDERDEHAIFYAIPRRNELILGGCAVPTTGSTPPSPDPEVARAILARAASRGIAHGPVRRHVTGLRPCRPTVRLEPDADDPRIIHNYGHGGSGFTLCWGCAQEAADLVQRVPTSPS